MAKLGKRFFECYESEFVKRLRKKSRIEQVQHRVLGSPDIQIHGKPFLELLLGSEFLCIVWICKTKEIPAGTHKGIHGVYLGFPSFPEYLLRTLKQFFGFA